MNLFRSAAAGSNDPNIAALEATKGRRAHHTCSRFGAGNGVIGVRSRKLSMPNSAIGSQSSINRLPLIDSRPRGEPDQSTASAARSRRGADSPDALPSRANKPLPLAPLPRFLQPLATCSRACASAPTPETATQAPARDVRLFRAPSDPDPPSLTNAE